MKNCVIVVQKVFYFRCIVDYDMNLAWLIVFCCTLLFQLPKKFC